MASQGKAMLMLLLLSTMVAAATAGVYSVGGESGWTFGSNSVVTLSAGDTIRFQYPPRLHNVWQVSQEDYNNCQSSSPYAIYNSGNDNIYLPSQGAYYFMCSVEGHCNAGMKAAIYVQ